MRGPQTCGRQQRRCAGLVARAADEGRSPAAAPAGLALASTVLLGLIPSRQASRANVQVHLQAASRTIISSRTRAGRLLLVSQVAMSLVPLVGAGLLAGSLARLRGIAKGFEEERLLLVEINARMPGLERNPRHGMPPPPRPRSS